MGKCTLDPDLFLLSLAVYVILSVPAFGADLNATFPPATAHAGQNTSTPRVPRPNQKGVMDWEGNISNQTEALVTVIMNNDEWTALWSRAFSTQAPTIDFDTYAVACVFLGYHAPWLYDIHIGEPREVENMYVIPYGLSEIMLRLSGPFRASGQYRMKGVEKKGPGMKLEMMKGSVPLRHDQHPFP